MTSNTQHSPLTTATADRPVSRLEIAAVLAITLTGFGLRVAFPSHAAIEHFDEGVYATRLWFAEGDDAPYPDRHLYAPPLVPWMVRWSIDLFGPGLWGAMLPAVVFGTLTIPLLWWTGRRWFGTVAGLAGAVLAAGSDFHVLYSRTALTDVPLCFWLLASVYCAWESFRAAAFRWAIAAGVAAGLAWWTKYNGWLAVAIAVAGAVPWLLTRRLGESERAAGRSAGRVAGCAIVLAIVACAVWSPVYLWLQEHGGYGAVVANHRQYALGLDGWILSFLQHVANHRFLDGLSNWIAVGLAFSLPLMWRVANRRDVTRRGCLGILAILVLAIALSLTYGSSTVLAVAGLAGILGQLFRPFGAGANGNSRVLAAWLLLAWFSGLLVATPLYRAYPRLTLPWLVAAWLGTSAGLDLLVRVRWWDPRMDSRPEQVRVGLALGLAIMLGALHVSSARERLAGATVIGWQDRSGMQTLADRIAADASSAAEAGERNAELAVPFVVYVYAEPPLVFHFTERGIVAQPAAALDFVFTSERGPQVPTLLVVGPHAEETPEFGERWPAFQGRFRQVAEYSIPVSDLVSLDHGPESDLFSGELRPTEKLRLYILR